jgi:hypothetical protein
VDALERYVRAGLELAGEEVDDVDIAVIRAADAAYGGELAALDQADLADVLPETDLDPSRPPRELDQADLADVLPETDLDPSRPPREL